MPLPDNLVDLQLAGYRYAGSSHCLKCHARLEWFFTRNNAKMPFSAKVDVMINDEGNPYLKASLDKLEVHFAVCPFAEQFRRKKKK